MRAICAILAACSIVVIGCGSSQPKPTQAVATKHPQHARPLQQVKPTKLREHAATDSPVEPRRAELPQVCTGAGESENKNCYPPEDFVSLLCQRKYPGVAVRMFERSAPWQRGYIKVKDVAPINSHGGPSASTRLEFLEEVVILRMRPNKYREMVADMPNSFDVFRFDGTCATLAEDEFMTKKPVLPPRYAPFVWSQIDPAIRRALAQDSKVEKARLDQTELCHGTILTGGSGACKEATQKLARAILLTTSHGSPLPLPDDLPDWPKISSATARIDRDLH